MMNRKAHQPVLKAFCWLSWALLLGITLNTPAARAQDDGGLEMSNQLRLVDNSSPRDTLRSFLEFSQEFDREVRAGGSRSRIAILLRGATETMDFSSTAFGASRSEQVKRVLGLYEILARIELPPWSQIPGDEDVAAQDIAEWIVPGTRLRITRESEGLQAGEYLFSALTVDRLDLAYRKVRSQPRRRGGPDALQTLLERGFAFAADQERIATRLQGMEASSPLATLEEFLTSMNAAYQIAFEAEDALTADPPRITLDEALDAQRRAGNHLRRAGAAFDLSKVPAAQRDDVSVEAALLLKEVLDRMFLPPIESVPDTPTVAALEGTDTPFSWRIPGTEIEIQRMLEGPRTGKFLFDSNTVRSLPGIYEKLQDLPYRQQAKVEDTDIWRSPQISPGSYDFYISTPGYLVPSTHLLGRLVHRLPDSWKTLYSGQTLWQWIGLGITLAAALLAGWLTFRLIAGTARRLGKVAGSWLMILAPLLVGYGVSVLTDFIDNDLNFTGNERGVVLTLGGLTILFFRAWVVWRFFSATATTITDLPGISKQSIDGSLIRIVAGLLGIVLGTGVIVAGLRNLGVDVVPLIAGLGVGGLAVALAIRPTLENLIGGIILFADKPIRVGDYCSFGGMAGTVENIGVRSTQIRGLDRTLISIPNAKFADMELINWAQCDRMMISTTIGLRYETDDDQLRYVLLKIREMLHAHPKIDPDTIRVRFAGYGASSLDVDIRIYALTRDWNEFHGIREDVFFRIKAIVSGSGTGFAFPSQTLYMGRDDGLDGELGETAKQEVESLRGAGKLPFPQLSAERIGQLEGTLDYPPRGSVNARHYGEQEAEPLSTEPQPDQGEMEEQEVEGERR